MNLIDDMHFLKCTEHQSFPIVGFQSY